MTNAIKKLQKVQGQISERNAPHRDDYYTERLYFAVVHGLLHIEFYGDAFGESLSQLCELLGDEEVAGVVKSLTFRGQDEGCNGTRNWQFQSLAESNAFFPKLTTLYIEPTSVAHHNQSVIANLSDQNESGIIAKLVSKMPLLEMLTIPSAPDSTFFDIGERPLAVLQVDAGYNHQNFILNLSKSENFPLLRHLDFADYNQTYMENYIESCTPFSHYIQFIKSPHFANLRGITIRNSVLTDMQFFLLHRLRKDTQLYVIRSHGKYINIPKA